VPYAKSLESFDLSFRALEICFHGIQMSEMSAPASRAIDKIIRTSSLIRLHITEVAQAVQQLLLSSVDIVDTVHVVEGYTFLVAMSIEKDDIPEHISVLMEAFGNVDINSCDPNLAFRILKVVFAIGKTLYSTAPRKLESKGWTEGYGREMSEWVRGIVAMFCGRFSEDFEIMEVIYHLALLRIDYHKYDSILFIER